VTGYLAASSSSTIGVFGGGYNSSVGDYLNVIGYVTIASTGNATDFGDLTVKRSELTSCSSNIRSLFAGGDSSGRVNVIDYITIASAGNATDFGDLSQLVQNAAGCSNAHGGL
jgi:hypothetical protein